MGRTSCKPAARSSSATLVPAFQPTEGVPIQTPILHRAPRLQERTLQGPRLHESFTIIHSPAGGDHAVDGGRPAGGRSCLLATSRLRAAGSGLPNDSSRDFLSGCGSRRHGVVGDFASGAAVWAGSRTEPDDLDEFVWQFGDHASVCARPEY